MSSWSLGRTIKEYHHFKRTPDLHGIYPPREGRVNKTFFKNCYKPFHQNLEGLERPQIRTKLQTAIRFSIFKDSTKLIASICGVVGAILLIAGPQAIVLFPAIVLLIASTGINFVPTIVKQFYNEKKPPIAYVSLQELKNLPRIEHDALPLPPIQITGL